jgi:hypothetical protein
MIKETTARKGCNQPGDDSRRHQQETAEVARFFSSLRRSHRLRSRRYRHRSVRRSHEHERDDPADSSLEVASGAMA